MKKLLPALTILCLTSLVGCATAPTTGPERAPEGSANLVTTTGSVGGLFLLGDPEIGPDGEPNSDATYDAQEIMETVAMIVTIPILTYAYGMAHSGYAGVPSN